MTMSITNLSDEELLKALLGVNEAEKVKELSLAEIFGFSSRQYDFIGVQEEFVVYNKPPMVEVAKELLSRALACKMTDHVNKFTCSSDISKYLALRLGSLDHEEFHCLWLDTHHRLIAHEKISIGTLAEARVYPREVVRSAMKLNASAVVLVHNHPSGSLEPSHADEALTKLISQALKFVDVKVLDHIIIAGNESFSFSEKGLI